MEDPQRSVFIKLIISSKKKKLKMDVCPYA